MIKKIVNSFKRRKVRADRTDQLLGKWTLTRIDDLSRNEGGEIAPVPAENGPYRLIALELLPGSRFIERYETPDRRPLKHTGFYQASEKLIILMYDTFTEAATTHAHTFEIINATPTELILPGSRKLPHSLFCYRFNKEQRGGI